MFIQRKDKYIASCNHCGKTWEFDGYELIFCPYPHFECPDCGEAIPAF